MQPSPRTYGVVHFGPFEVDLEEGVLRKRGTKVKLQTQPFQVLAALLEKPGTAVTRDELRQRLWPADTFVDFERGLNTAVARLRQALGDSAEQPRYIETLAKRGYRFTAKVVSPSTKIKGESPSGSGAAPEHIAAPWIVATVVLAACGTLAFLFVSNPTPTALHPAPLTTFRGMEVNPALSPDGNHLAFAWNGEKQENFDIYVMPIRSNALTRLTSDPAEDSSPVWSPDGHTIAFLRRLDDGHSGLMLVPAVGGPEHNVAETREQPWFAPRRSTALAWSPDGRWIAASHREPGDLSEGIYLFSRAGEKRRLTTPPSDFCSDTMPAFSPDGRALAFCRLPASSVSEIYLLSLDSNFGPSGEVRRLTDHKRWSAQPVWIRGGRSILHVFGEDVFRRREIRIINVLTPQAAAGTIPLKDDVSEVAVGSHLVYTRRIEDTNIWRARIPAAGDPPASAELFISSTWSDQQPRYSPDGKEIAFSSSRSGSREIWVSKADGSNPVRMTSFGGPLVGLMNWSPDGQWITFHARPEAQADVFVIPAAGGSPKRLTTNNSDDNLPSYSRDGRWIYFSSKRSGELQIWRMPAAGGAAEQITTSDGGYIPIESPDGKTLYYLLMKDRVEIWSVPARGGPSVRVTGPTLQHPGAFAVTSEGIYYGAPPHSAERRFVRFFSFRTGQSTPVVLAKRPLYMGMSVSPDSRYLLFDQGDESGSDLMLVENFRSPP